MDNEKLNSNAKEKRVLDSVEAAQYLGISYWLVGQLVRKNELPHFRVGGRILFRKKVIDKVHQNVVDERRTLEVAQNDNKDCEKRMTVMEHQVIVLHKELENETQQLGEFKEVVENLRGKLSKLESDERFHREEKIDQGFVFFFWKLSSRRKFIRTLWLLPLFFTALILVQITFDDPLFTAVIGSEILLVFIVQLAYYVKWKSDKQSSQSDQ